MTEAPQDPDSQHSKKRNRAIQSAVVTSLASKVGTALLQLVSIPIAYRVLGPEAFGLYASVAMAVGTVVLMQFGIGPALTHGLSRAHAENNPQLEREYFSTSWFLMLGLALLGGSVISILLKAVPLTFFFGEKYRGLEDQMMPALWLALGIILLEFILSHTERAREGYLEVYINNLWGAAGNIVGAIAVGVGIHFQPTIEFLIIAVYGSHVFAKGGNTIHLLLRRKNLIPKLSLFRRKLARTLFSDGLAFTVSHSLTTIIEVNCCSLIVAHMAGPKAVGTFLILTQLSTFMLGFILMFTTPIWPSIVDAYSRKDFPWVRKTLRRLWLLVLAYTLAGVVGLTFLGPILIPLWMGPEFEINWMILLPFSLYFLARSWAHANQAMLIGVGMVRRSAVVALAETLLLLIPVYFFTKVYGLSGMYSAMFLTMLVFTAWIFPRMLLKRIRDAEGELAPRAIQA